MSFSRAISRATTSCFCLAAFFPTLLCAQTPPDPSRIPGAGKLAKVSVVGTQRFSEEAAVSATALVPGQDILREDMQAAADRLSSLGVFQNVRYNFRSQQDKVELVFQVDDAPLVPAFFDNFPWFTDEELVAAIRQATPLFNDMLPPAGLVLEQATEAIAKLLPERRIQGTVQRELIGQIYADGMMMRFRLEGPSLKVGQVQFQNEIAAADSRLRIQAQELVGKPYSRFAVEMFVNEHVRPLYDERGLLRAAYGRPQARFTGDPNKPLADNVLVLIPIEPGAVYRWGGVTWQGNAAFGPVALNSFVPFPSGEPANGVRIAQLWHKIEDEYGRRGYIEAKVLPAARYDETQKRVHYEVTITEGSIYRMGELVITGLSALAQRKLREAWTLQKGAVFSRAYFQEFLSSCENKKVFADYVVHYDEVGHLLQPKPDGTVDVLIDFK